MGVFYVPSVSADRSRRFANNQDRQRQRWAKKQRESGQKHRTAQKRAVYQS